MIHVWLINQQGNLRVFNEGALSAAPTSDTHSTGAWLTIDGLQALGNLPFLKANDKQICLYLTTQSFLTLNNNLSNAQLKQLGVSGQQYLFEDIALTPVEQLSVKQWADDRIPNERYFYALPESVIERWQKSAEFAGLTLTAILPDFLLLPVASNFDSNQVEQSYNSSNSFNRKNFGTKLKKTKKSIAADKSAPVFDDTDSLHMATVLHDVEYDRYIVRQSEVHGVALSHPSLLPRLLEGVEKVIYIENAVTSDLEDDKNTDLSLHKKPSKTAFEDLFLEHNLELSSINHTLIPVTSPLRHPLNFAPTKHNNYFSPYLALAVSLALLAGVVQILADAIEGYKYDQAAIGTQSATNEQFSNWFDGQNINKRETLEAQLAPFLLDATAEGESSLEFLKQVTRLVKQAGGSTAIIAQSINLSEENLQLVLQSPRRDVIDKLYQSLTAQGMAANLESVNTQPDGKVVATLALSLPNKGADPAPN